MLKTAIRFLLLRFLPGRLVPLLTAIEVVRLVRRLRARRPDTAAPRRIVTSAPPAAPRPEAQGSVRPPRSP